MSLDTYAGLQSAIGDFLNRADLTAVIPTFISMAEAVFNRRIRTRDMEVRSTLTASTRYTSLPADFREGKFVRLTVSAVDYPLGYLDQRSMVAKRNGFNGTAQQPQYFSIISGNLELCPDPDQAYPVELGYYGAIPALSVSNTTNWLLTKHPDAYLYGALLHSAPYLKDDSRIDVWGTAHEAILESIRIENQQSEYSGGTLRVNARSIG